MSATVVAPTDAPRGPTRRVVARGEVVVARGRGGTPRLRRCRTAPPLGVRIAGGELHLLGTAQGPLGGDDLELDLTVEAGTRLTVRSVAATIALPGDGSPSRQRVTVTVADGASLRWLPEPLVAAAGCDHRSTTEVQLAPNADLVWRDEVVLGRSGEHAGRLTQRLRVLRDGRPLVHHGLDSRGAAATPVVGTARAAGFAVAAGSPAASVHDPTAADVAVERLAADLVTVTAVAGDTARLRGMLDRTGIDHGPR